MKFRKNTTKQGTVRYVVFKEAGDWYAAALEFNIVESGSTAQEAMLLLFEAIQGYVEIARKIKVRPYVLNQKPDAEYEQMWKNIQNNKLSANKQEVYTAGQLALA